MADELHEVVRDILTTVAARGRTITYEALLDAVERRDPALRRPTEAHLAGVLRAVSTAEDDAGRGLITAVVVRQGSRLPGGGFFRLAADRGREVSDRHAAWAAELAHVHRVHSGGA